MTLSIEATYDGQAFLPASPIKLKPNTRVQLSVEVEDEPVSFFEVAQSLKLDGPPDWSRNLDKYLYGEQAPDGS